MTDISQALNAHEVNPDLRVSFWGEWGFNEDLRPEIRAKFPLFQDIEDTFREAFKPYTSRGGSYRFSLVSRFCELIDGRFIARHVTPLMTVTTRIGQGDPPRIYLTYGQVTEPLASIPVCSSCQGLAGGERAESSEAGIPLPVLDMHRALVKCFKAPQFAKIRDHRAFMVASGLQRMEGLQGPQAAEFQKVGPGLFQILFVGTVFGFDSKLPGGAALVHYPDVWNCPVKLKGIHGADIWSYPDNVERLKSLADELGVDPNAPREHAEHPWRRPCATCQGRGYT